MWLGKINKNIKIKQKKLSKSIKKKIRVNKK